MFTSDSGPHADAPTQHQPSPHNPRNLRLVASDGQRLSAAEIAAEMQARNALPIALERLIARSSRLMGVGLFLIALSSTGWMVAGLL